MKRLLDVMLALFCLLIFSPIMCIVALLVYLDLGRPILFRQQRPGLHGKPFHLIKFRTMLDIKDAAEAGDKSDAARLTAVGKFIRETSLDELPELLNVLVGDMSFVGPRPLLMEYLSLYTVEQMRRHDVKPGLTGWAQVNGRNAISWDKKFKLDLWYVDNRSFYLDIKIMFLTILKVIKREGVTGGGEATTSRFTGSVDRDQGK